jgi:hypothetical protein
MSKSFTIKCLYTYIHMCINIDIYMYIHINVYIYYIYIHIFIYIHLNICIYTCNSSLSCSKSACLESPIANLAAISSSTVPSMNLVAHNPLQLILLICIYMYIHIYIYIYVYTHIYIYIYICMYICNICIHISMYIYLNTYIYTHLCVLKIIILRTNRRTCISAHMNIILCKISPKKNTTINNNKKAGSVKGL